MRKQLGIMLMAIMLIASVSATPIVFEQNLFCDREVDLVCDDVGADILFYEWKLTAPDGTIVEEGDLQVTDINNVSIYKSHDPTQLGWYHLWSQMIYYTYDYDALATTFTTDFGQCDLQANAILVQDDPPVVCTGADPACAFMPAEWCEHVGCELV